MWPAVLAMSGRTRPASMGTMDAEVGQEIADDAGLVGDVPSIVPPPRPAPAAETVRLYASDWAAFVAWCDLAGAVPLPAAPATVATYLAVCRRATQRRRVGPTCRRHRCSAPPAWFGLARIRPSGDDAAAAGPPHRHTPTRTSRPLAAHLTRMATACPGDLAGLRDRALLLLAAAGLGRSALVGLDVEQVRFMEAGVDLVLHSQLGAERTVTVRRVASLGACPVRALKDWIDATDSRFGPVFRKVDRWGNVEHRRLGTDAIRRILARRARRRVRRGAAP